MVEMFLSARSLIGREGGGEGGVGGRGGNIVEKRGNKRSERVKDTCMAEVYTKAIAHMEDRKAYRDLLCFFLVGTIGSSLFWKSLKFLTSSCWYSCCSSVMSCLLRSRASWHLQQERYGASEWVGE